MSSSDDFDAYLKGYEDAMIAAGQGQTRPGPARRRGPRWANHDITATIGEGIGRAFGWLVLFPVFMGLAGGSIAWVLGGDFGVWALVWGGLAFLNSLFVGTVVVAWRIFVAAWPVVLLAVAVIVVVTKLAG